MTCKKSHLIIIDIHSLLECWREIMNSLKEDSVIRTLNDYEAREIELKSQHNLFINGYENQLMNVDLYHGMCIVECDKDILKFLYNREKRVLSQKTYNNYLIKNKVDKLKLCILIKYEDPQIYPNYYLTIVKIETNGRYSFLSTIEIQPSMSERSYFINYVISKIYNDDATQERILPILINYIIKKRYKSQNKIIS